MLDIGWSEMLIILVVALIVIGPKDLPRVARNVGRWVGKARSMAREFQTQLEDMAREAELDKVKDEIEKASRTDIKRSVEKTIDPDNELGRAFDTTASNGSAKRAAPKPPSKSKSAKPASASASKPSRDRAEKPEAAAADTVEPSSPVRADRERVPAETI